MNFLNPFLLIGLISIAVPVVIHLINLRKPKKLPFPTLTFFEELKNSTIRRIRIKQYLLLALRIAAILMLALALARPFIPPSMGGSTERGKTAVILLIDNSPSMNRIGSEGPFLDQAKKIARFVVNNSSDNDRFIVTGANGESGSMVFTNRTRAIELIDQLRISKSGNYLDDRINFIANQLSQVPFNGSIIYLITDGQLSQLNNLNEVEANYPELLEYNMVIQPVILGSIEQSNVAVSNIELKSQMLGKDNPVTLEIEVQNFGTSIASNHFVSAEVLDRMVGQYEISLGPGESKELLFEVIPNRVGSVKGKVIIEGDDVTYDNERFFVINIPRIRNVLLINESQNDNSEFISYLKPALEAAKKSNTQIQFKEVRSGGVDQSSWLQNDVIILDGLKEIPEYWFSDLQRFVQDGNGVLFLPSEQGNIQNYNDFTGLFNAGRFKDIRGQYGSFRAVAQLDNLKEGHPILDGLFDKKEDESIQLSMPDLFYYYQFEASTNAGSFEILRSDIGDHILTEKRFGDGKFIISSIGSDPGWSNFPVNALFAPLFYRTILYVSSSEQGGLIEHILGNTFEWRGEIENHNIDLELDDITYRPEINGVPNGVKIEFDGKDWVPGILRIRTQKSEYLVAVNQDITESDFESLSNQELDILTNNFLNINEPIDVDNVTEQSLKDKLSSAGFGKEIWNWFIWIGLLLLVVESLITRLYKAESIS